MILQADIAFVWAASALRLKIKFAFGHGLPFRVVGHFDIVEHNDGGIRDQEGKPICYKCFDKFRIRFANVRKKLARYDEFQQSTGNMRVTNK